MTEQSPAELIFFAALEKSNPAEQAAYLDEACRDQPGLRARVEKLLTAHPRVGQFLNEPVAKDEATAAYAAPVDLSGTVVAGKYKLREKLGEGGMGSVWVADQLEPVQRRVALKLIKVQGDSRSMLARFEQERQALALMDHPNIAKVFDAGVDQSGGGESLVGSPSESRGVDTPRSGQPYFVMELIKGVPITKYCDDAKLTMQQRLELFVPVCQVVQHAHQKGVIHRDLKPGNILIGLYDGKPVPKVIDFGVAKATGSRLTDQTIYTEVGSLVGTLEYMSPEQAELNNLDIDTRSDIYALGVILYELLTGSVPFSRKELTKAGFGEMLRVIKEVEPPKPSTKLSGSGTLPSIAANRHTEPTKLTRLVKGDLDWIVMKALEKDRSRRYETANGFAADVMRYLTGETVTAVPPSMGYRFKKFVKRNRGKVLAAGLVMLALLLGMAGTLWGLVEARRERDLAEVETQQAIEARHAALDAQTKMAEAMIDLNRAKLDALKKSKQAEEAKEQAQKRLTQIEKANDLLGSIFESLDPKEIARAERPLQAILVEKLDQAVAQLEGESIGDPLVVAAMQHNFGVSLLGLGEPGKAVVLLEKACATRQAKLGHEHPDTLNSMINLAGGYRAAGQLDLALPLSEKTLRLMKAKFGHEHPDTLRSMSNLALAYHDAGKLDLALPLHKQTLQLRIDKLGPDHLNTLQSMHNLALTYQAAGKQDLALPLKEQALKLEKAKFGPEHPYTLAGMNNLALAYQAAGKWDLALPLLQETHRLTQAKLGPEHPETLTSMGNLAVVYQNAGKLELALSLHDEALKLRRAKLGPEHPDTLRSMHALAWAYQAAGKLDVAITLNEETQRLMQAKLGPDHPTTLTNMGNLGSAYCDANQGEKATATLKKFVAGERKRAKPDDLQFAARLAEVALDLLKCGQHTAAEEILRECLAIREKSQPNTWTTFNTKSMLGGALLGQKKHAEAEPLLLQGYQGMMQREKSIPINGRPRLRETLDCLIQLYTETNKPDEVKKWQAKKAKLPATSSSSGKP